MTVINHRDFITQLSHLDLLEKKQIEALLPYLKLYNNYAGEINQRTSLLSDRINTLKKSSKARLPQLSTYYDPSHNNGTAIVEIIAHLLSIPDIKTSLSFIVDKLASKNWYHQITNTKTSYIKLLSILLLITSTVSNISNASKGGSILNASEAWLIKSLKISLRRLAKEIILPTSGGELSNKVKKLASRNKKISIFLPFVPINNQRNVKDYFNLCVSSIKACNSHKNDNIICFIIKLSGLIPHFNFLSSDKLKQELFQLLDQLTAVSNVNKVDIIFDSEEPDYMSSYVNALNKIIENYPSNSQVRFGFTIQSCYKNAFDLVSNIIDTAIKNNKIIPIRLIAGDYLLEEMHYSKVSGRDTYPVFTRNIFIEASFLACAAKMLEAKSTIKPLFVTCNPSAISNISQFAQDGFEFQVFQNFRADLSKILNKEQIRICLIVGDGSQFLTHLPGVIANDLISQAASYFKEHSFLKSSTNTAFYEKVISTLNNIQNKDLPSEEYTEFYNREHMRDNLIDITEIENIKKALQDYKDKIYTIGSVINGKNMFTYKNAIELFNPGKNVEKIGELSLCTESELKHAIEVAYLNRNNFINSNNRAKRIQIIKNIAGLYLENKYEIYSILMRHLGYSLKEAVRELNQAMDACYHYIRLEEDLNDYLEQNPKVINKNIDGVCFSGTSFYFPLASFTAQVVGLLVTGNSIIVRPEPEVSIIAHMATSLMYKSGVPENNLQLVFASEHLVNTSALVNPYIKLVLFSGLQDHICNINKILSQREDGIVPFIYENFDRQGIVIVDSTIDPGKLAYEVIRLAFSSAGQGVGAPKVLYIQEEIYNDFIKHASSIIDYFKVGDPLDTEVHIGPMTFDTESKLAKKYKESMIENGYKVVLSHGQTGLLASNYQYPYMLEIESSSNIQTKPYGPVLHLISYKNEQIDHIIEDINKYPFSFNLTIFSKIESRIKYICHSVHATEFYLGSLDFVKPQHCNSYISKILRPNNYNYLMSFVHQKLLHQEIDDKITEIRELQEVFNR